MANLNKIIKQLEKVIRKIFVDIDVCHDINHLKRTMNLALAIQKKEGGDRIIIAIAALLHDLHRVMHKQSGIYHTPKESLPKIKKIIDKIELSEYQKNRILHCIEHHEEYSFTKSGKAVNDIETMIVQDADNLDAIGAIGIGRTFAYSGAYDIPMWVVEEPLFRVLHDPDKHDPSAIHHCYRKLLKLKDDMNTKTAKKIATHRHKFMEKFLKEFFDEWKGIK